jgi:hypothetical protein
MAGGDFQLGPGLQEGANEEDRHLAARHEAVRAF